MNIVFIIAKLDNLGGTERVATSIANGLSKLHDVSVLSRYTGQTNAYKLYNTVNDVKFNGSIISFIKQLKDYIYTNQPDVVVIHTMSKLTPVLLLSGLNCKRMVSLEHISFQFHSCPFQFFRNIFYKRLSAVVTLTEADAKYYTSITKSVEVIPNACPLDISKESRNPRPHVVLAIGRLTRQKGFDLLLNAWRTVESQHPTWALHIYGQGEEKENLFAQVNQLNLTQVKFKGMSDNIITAYQQAEIYVLSSRYEGFGMVLVEAQSQGLPIVSFNCPSGPSEIITHQKDGFLVENGNVDELAHKMIDLIRSPKLRRSFSKSAIVASQRYQQDVITKMWLDFIDEVTEK